LSIEAKKIRKDIKKLKLEYDLLKPNYIAVKIELEELEDKIQLFIERLIKRKELTIDDPDYNYKIEKKITEKYPNYQKVELAYNKIADEFNKKETQIIAASNSENIIKSCLAKIKLYFKNKS